MRETEGRTVLVGPREEGNVMTSGEDTGPRSEALYAAQGNAGHVPVLVSEVLYHLRPHDGGVYIDATLGAGGHSEALLEASEPGGRVIGLDRDDSAIERSRRRLAEYGERFTAAVRSFAEIETVALAVGVAAADGILADLGLSSMQLADAERGFAFSVDGPLDMRFDRTLGPSAADLVNALDVERIEEILREYGEERRARAIARRIVSRRPMETTAELRRAVHSVVGPRRRHGIDPATRAFQALRIAVNQELAALELLMQKAPALLSPGGRLVVISYHSLEDRIVKHAMRDLARRDEVDAPRYRVLTKKPIVASKEETSVNPRARSAKLRVLERDV